MYGLQLLIEKSGMNLIFKIYALISLNLRIKELKVLSFRKTIHLILTIHLLTYI